MRIITGIAKGKRLAALPGEDITRPTSERTKQAMFSTIQFDIEHRQVLDLFAGTGQLGLEAMSRGADSVYFVDADREAMGIVKQNATATGFFDRCRFLCSDYRSYLRKASGRDSYSLIFLDPPYGMCAVGDAVERILSGGMAQPGAIFVCESAEEDIFCGREALWERFEIIKKSHYGVAHVHILRLTEERDSE